ncbi:hypothetical protein RZS08_00765, partial [Arthrospira platensis SPKY1]|nr:hypothetical protein [Arthrospira platensis SPKY1]
RDTEAPVFVQVPGELHLECDQPIPSGQPEVQDNCDGDPELEMTETKLPGTCAQEFTLIRRWIATDDCGNSSSAEQLIKVKDTTPPVIMTLHPGLNGVESGDTLIYECDDAIIYDVDDVKATDN